MPGRIGRWDPNFRCSVCGEIVRRMTPECPFCHAEMTGTTAMILHPVSEPPRVRGDYLCLTHPCDGARGWLWQVLSFRDGPDGRGFYRYDHEFGDVLQSAVLYWAELPDDGYIPQTM